MHVRLLEPADRSEWLRLLTGLYAGSADSDHAPPVDAFIHGQPLREHLPSAVFVIEREDGGLCGFLELSVRDYAEGCTGPAPYVESWFVDGDVRGQGLGRVLMRAAEEWSREHGFSELASDAELDNESSHAAHRALGFEEVERAVHFRKDL